MKQESKTLFRVGLFVFVALFIGGSLAFVIGKQTSLFSAKETYYTFFSDVAGLREGSSVRIGGVVVGTVSQVVLGDKGQTKVSLEITESKSDLVREGSIARIESKGMLGDKLVSVTVGEGPSLPPGSTIPAEEGTDFSQYMHRAGKILREVETTVTHIRKATEAFDDEAFRDQIRSTAEYTADIAEAVATGRGLAHELVHDPDLAEDFAVTIKNARGASAELATTMGNLSAVTSEVRRGDGTAHALVYGPEGKLLMQRLATASGELATLLESLRTSDGTFHDLMYEDKGDELIANLTATSENLRQITEHVRDGKGTVGAFLTDPSVYEDVKRLVGDLERNEILRSLVRYSIRKDEAIDPVQAVPLATED